ncbi:hypothetical protein N5J53_07070 [Empedobacter sp. GD03644]|uniref:hypothetical protein n=1 Tax=Empedobacter sp. GD03644 TaxID=2975358 RepID=UPI002447272A|nr:hypothetical protein [Empedobacter sp. GD03644]MDH2206751.1 hypothetical protein [Empedobacter sp. GD03644]
MNDSLKKHIDNNREAFENKEPSAELWKRIQAEIPKQEEKTLVIEQPKKWRIQNWSIAASALVLLSVGGYFFLKNDEVNSPKTIEVVKEKQVKKVEEIQPEIVYPTEIKTEQNEKEIQFVRITKEKKVEKVVQAKEELIGIDENLKNEILSSLNDQESTSNRINAIAKIADLPSIDHNLKKSLYNLALNDNNTIVRLNALEALASKLPKSDVSKELTDIFMKQDDPMVQMELIGMIAHINNDQIDLKLTNKLQEMVLDPTTKTFVKDEAYAVLFRK